MPEIPKDMNNASIKRVSPENQSGNSSKSSDKSTESSKSSSSSNSSSSDVKSKTESLSNTSDKSFSDGKKRAVQAVKNSVDKKHESDSPAKSEVEQDEVENKKQSKSLREAFKAGFKAVPVAAGVGIGTKMLMMMKAVMMGLGQAALAALHAVSGFLSSIVTTITSAVSTMASFLGTSVAVAGTIFGTVTVGGVVSLVMVGVVIVNSTMIGNRDTLIDTDDKCSTEYVEELQDDLDFDKETERRYKLIYKVLHDRGVPDINIAGCLGNFACEGGGVDSTAVEGIYGDDSRYKWTKQKQEIMSSPDDMRVWCEKLFASMDKTGASYSRKGYQKKNGDYQCGIGMAQWTAGSAEKLIKTAESVGADWYDFDFQVAFITTQCGPAMKEPFLNGIQGWTEPCETVADAAILFAHKYEGQYSNAMEKRQTKAESFYIKITTDWSLSPLDKLSNGIMGFLSKLKDAVDKVVTGDTLSECDSKTSAKFGDPGGGYYGYPVDPPRNISAGFPNYSDGTYHGGVDFSVPENSNIYAAYDGTVIVAKNLSYSYGHYIKIQHPDGNITIYGHNNDLLVKVGDTVQRGQIIARSGSTGKSTGPHCHFEVNDSSGNRVNPLDYLEKDDPNSDDEKKAA